MDAAMIFIPNDIAARCNAVRATVSTKQTWSCPRHIAASYQNANGNYEPVLSHHRGKLVVCSRTLGHEKKGGKGTVLCLTSAAERLTFGYSVNISSGGGSWLQGWPHFLRCRLPETSSACTAYVMMWTVACVLSSAPPKRHSSRHRPW